MTYLAYFLSIIAHCIAKMLGRATSSLQRFNLLILEFNSEVVDPTYFVYTSPQTICTTSEM